MAIHMFAAIDVGSYELGMKIFEVSRAKGIREIDHVTHRIDLGSDTYQKGKISRRHVQEVVRVLQDFKRIMKTYRVEDYKAYGTSAIREMENASLILSQWEQETGIHVDVLSNSEQRFLDYKSIASKGEAFNKIISDTCAIVDIGGGSTQISMFGEDRLSSTQNLRLGVLRMHSELSRIDARASQAQALIEELVNSQIEVYQKLYLGQKQIHNLIIVDDYVSAFMNQRGIEYISAAEFGEYVSGAQYSEGSAYEQQYGISGENFPLLYITGVMIRCIVKALGVEQIWAPGVTLCDGIVYEYAETRKILPPSHNFEDDIFACAKNISKRYQGSMTRSKTIEKIALAIFDATKKVHGMGTRERLLLRIAATLHDCGKYISMMNLAECSYNIIMSTEIIGLSHIEREIVANVVRFNHDEFVYYEAQELASDLDQQSYLTITKLTAILRLANGLDRSHKQKFSDIRISLKNDQMVINVKAGVDITLEKGMFDGRAEFFEEVLGIRPVIRQKAMQ